MRQAPVRLQQLIEPIVMGLGYETVGIEYLPQAAHGLLRIYIDAPAGIGIADCELVSHQVSGMLDVEDPITGGYTLEVSSPGIDRPLFKPADFDRFAGQQVKLRLSRALDGRSRFSGVLRGIEQQTVTVEVAGEALSFAYEEIENARLVGSVRRRVDNVGEP